MKKPFFTVFTPVYNRREKISRVYNSLVKQTFRDFEWIVIDDGSQDNVIPLLEEFKENSDFRVIIRQQRNSGKHIAWNKAVELAQGELFVPADSDDEFVENTLEFFFTKWKLFPDNVRYNYSGINVLCADPLTGEIIGEKFPQEDMITNNLELYYKYKVMGEKWGCIRTDLLRKIPFPKISQKGLVYPEGYLWFSLAKEYKVICFNTVLRLYYRDDASLMNTKDDFKKFNSYAPARYHYMIWNINNNNNWMMKYSPKGYFKNILSLCTNGIYLNKSWLEIIGEMKGIVNRIFTILIIPVSFFYLKYLLNKYRAK